MSGRV